jgi:hypothetical protein
VTELTRDFSDEEFASIHRNWERCIATLAQSQRTPALSTAVDDGLRALDGLLNAVQELHEQVETLKRKVISLEMGSGDSMPLSDPDSDEELTMRLPRYWRP